MSKPKGYSNLLECLYRDAVLTKMALLKETGQGWFTENHLDLAGHFIPSTTSEREENHN